MLLLREIAAFATYADQAPVLPGVIKLACLSCLIGEADDMAWNESPGNETLCASMENATSVRTIMSLPSSSVPWAIV